jgi:hypothetical protein
MEVSTMTFDPNKYVTITPDRNIGLRDSQDTDYFWQTQPYTGPSWAQDGFSPKLARKIAERILELADEAEKPLPPDFWPPRKGDLWQDSAGTLLILAFGPTNVVGVRTTSGMREVRSVQMLPAEGWHLIYREGVRP